MRRRDIAEIWPIFGRDLYSYLSCLDARAGTARRIARSHSRRPWTTLAGFYLGAGARCVWSGAIIAGQFFFYDLARQLLNVAADDLLVVLDVNL